MYTVASVSYKITAENENFWDGIYNGSSDPNPTPNDLEDASMFDVFQPVLFSNQRLYERQIPSISVQSKCHDIQRRTLVTERLSGTVLYRWRQLLFAFYAQWPNGGTSWFWASYDFNMKTLSALRRFLRESNGKFCHGGDLLRSLYVKPNGDVVVLPSSFDTTFSIAGRRRDVQSLIDYLVFMGNGYDPSYLQGDHVYDISKAAWNDDVPQFYRSFGDFLTSGEYEGFDARAAFSPVFFRPWKTQREWFRTLNDSVKKFADGMEEFNEGLSFDWKAAVNGLPFGHYLKTCLATADYVSANQKAWESSGWFVNGIKLPTYTNRNLLQWLRNVVVHPFSEIGDAEFMMYLDAINLSWRIFEALLKASKEVVGGEVEFLREVGLLSE